MNCETHELWMELCKQAAVEQDPNRLFDLVKQINDLLEQREKRITRLTTLQSSNLG